MNEREDSMPLTDLDKSGTPNAMVIYGGGGHGRSIIDLVRAIGGYEIVGVIDDKLTPGLRVMDVPILGGAEVLEDLVAKGTHLAVNAVGGIGDLESRMEIFQRLQSAGFDFPPLVHPSAVVEPSARLSPGVQILPQAYVGTQASIGFGVIVNNGAILSHDCHVGDYSGFAPGAILAGEVRVGKAVQVGMGVTINLRLTIGDGARIGNGAVIKADVPANTVVHAGAIWPVRTPKENT
jgi:sugar O-acyltransferase (sialic acid O-acetyltransferase NeuD family)